MLHRDLAPRNIMVTFDGDQIGGISLVDPDLVKSFREEQGGTHLTPRHEHALAYYGASLLDEKSRPTADGYALGFTILHLLTGEHPDLLREKVKNKRFWNKREETLLAGGVTERETNTFLHVLQRLTHPYWTHRIEDYAEAARCLRKRRRPSWKSSPLFTIRSDVRESWQTRRRKIKFEDIDALNFLQHAEQIAEHYSKDPETVLERLRIFGQTLKEADRFSLPAPADATRNLLSLVKEFHLRDQATILAEFVQVTTLSSSLFHYVHELLKQMKSELVETENI